MHDNGSNRRYLMEMAESGYNPSSMCSFHCFMMPYLMQRHCIEKNYVIADIGAGQGHGLIPLHNAGWKNLIAVDIDNLNFDLFKNKYGIDCHLCDINSQRLPFENESVDAVINFWVISSLKTPFNLLRESHRILKKGGIIFIVESDWKKELKVFWEDPMHIHPYDKVGIARLLRMYDFSPHVYSWGTAFGLGRLKIYRWLPALGMIGSAMLAVGRK